MDEWQRRIEEHLARIEDMLRSLMESFSEIRSTRHELKTLSSSISRMYDAVAQTRLYPTAKFHAEDAERLTQNFRELVDCLEEISKTTQVGKKDFHSPLDVLDNRFETARMILGQMARAVEDPFVKNTLGIVELTLKELKSSVREAFQKADWKLLDDCQAGIDEITSVVKDLQIALGRIKE